jgi:hypothetical protein
MKANLGLSAKQRDGVVALLNAALADGLSTPETASIL